MRLGNKKKVYECDDFVSDETTIAIDTIDDGVAEWWKQHSHEDDDDDSGGDSSDDDNNNNSNN